jgi:hypothetical protein
LTDYVFAGATFQAEHVNPVAALPLHYVTVLTRDGFATRVESCGSTWGGEKPMHLDTLLDRLAEHPLDRRFGPTFGRKLAAKDGLPGHGDQVGWHFFGNFLTYSHVFNIFTDDPLVIDTLRAAIRSNQRRGDYRAQVA